MVLLDSPLASTCHNATLTALYSIQILIPNPYLRKVGIGVLRKFIVDAPGRWFELARWFELHCLSQTISNQKYLLPMQAAWMHAVL
jgi:hypothetical protein